MAVNASIVINFSDDADSSASVNVELDPLAPENLDDDGELKSTFMAGSDPDTPVIIINHSDSLSIGPVTSTEGSMAGNNGPVTRTVEDDYTLFNGDETSVSYANATPVGIPSGFTFSNGTLKNVSAGPSTGSISYNVVFQGQYTLNPPADMVMDEDGNHEITIFIQMNGA